MGNSVKQTDLQKELEICPQNLKQGRGVLLTLLHMHIRVPPPPESGLVLIAG